MTRSRGRTARLTCALDVDISGATVHWYLHTDGEAPTHLLYVGSTGEAQYSEDEYKAKYRAEKTPLERKCSLQMYNVDDGDSALYYCASWAVTAAHRRGGAAQKRTGEATRHLRAGRYGADNSLPPRSSLVTHFLPDSGLAIDLIQDKLTVIKGPRKTARIACRLSGSATYVHWYRQKDSEAPDRVLYIPTSGGNPVRDDPTLRQKFNAEKNTDEYTLIIDNTQVEDSATYYCAAWEYHTARGAPAARSKTHVLGWGGGGALPLSMIQDKASLTKSFGKTARISCRASGSTGYIHWYRQKDNEDLRRAFYVDTSNGQVTYDEGTDRNRFKADDSGKVLVIDKVEESGGLALKMTQEAISITKGLTKTARFTCKSDTTVDFIHWYQHKDHEPPRRILYITTSSGLVTHDDSGERDKFTAATESYTLALNKMKQSDVAAYYCAAWTSHSDTGRGTPEQEQTPRGGLALTITQEAISITKGVTKTARFTCKLDERVDYVHWYQHKDHEPPRRILYITTSSGSVAHDDSGEREKFSADGKSYTLALKSIEQGDKAAYYCAAWITHSDTGRGTPAQEQTLRAACVTWRVRHEGGWGRRRSGARSASQTNKHQVALEMSQDGTGRDGLCAFFSHTCPLL
ncbi:KV6A9 protein, partial [Polypterus senegalus]|nr:KV6A9 protein [Polypterus senegalus]